MQFGRDPTSDFNQMDQSGDFVSIPSETAMDTDDKQLDVESSSSSGEEPTLNTTQLGDVTVVQEERILDRTGQDVGDPSTELEALSADLLQVDYTNTRLRDLPPLAHLHQVEVRSSQIAPIFCTDL